MLELRKLGLSPGELSGLVAVVTGAAQGIGREIALALGWLGAKVVAVDMIECGEQTANAVREAGGEAIFMQADVADEVSVRRVGDLVLSQFGRVDLLINNAAYSPVMPLLELDVTTWDRVMAVNLRGTFLFCRELLPALARNSQAAIINLVSANAMTGMTAYIASKQGIAGFSQSLAAEVGNSGVRVVAFGPGMVDTPGFRAAAQGLAKQGGATAEQILETAISAEQSAAAACYLIARLAGDYHGEVTDVYQVLDRASATGEVAHVELTSADQTPPTSLEHCPLQVAGHCQSIVQIVREMDLEFSRLPVFVRPIARSQFRSRSGKSANEWVAGLESLAQQALNNGVRAVDGWLIALERLIAYCQAVPGETARFTKDRDVLREITQLMQGREASIRELISQLQRLS